MLRALGVDAAVEEVYLELLAAPDADTAAVADRLQRTEQQVRAALDTLAELALLRPSRADPTRMVPLSPPLALQTLRRAQEQQLAQRRQEIEAGHAAASRLLAEYESRVSAEATQDTQRIVGVDAIQARLDELVFAAEVEVLSLVPGRSILPEALAASAAADAALAERGVSCRVLYQDSVRNDPATLAYGEWMTEQGCQVRTSPVLPQRLLIVDRRTALMPLNPADPGNTAVCTTAPGMIEQLVALFELVWAGAEPLDKPRAVGEATSLTAAEHELLRMLAAGSTDDAAATRLGVSVRTVQRMMAELMNRLEASSRFEAGLKAAKRGWL